jgi:hypothetical protein
MAKGHGTKWLIAMGAVWIGLATTNRAQAGSISAALSPIDHVLTVPAARDSATLATSRAHPSQPLPSAAATSPPVTAIDHVLLAPATHASGTPQPAAVLATREPAQPRTPDNASSAPLSAIDHVLVLPASGTSGAVPTPHSIPAGLSGMSNLQLHLPDTPGAMMLASLRLPGKETPGELQLSHTTDESFRDPLLWSVMVYKRAHNLKVYYKGYLFGSYNAVFGRNPDPGTKEWAGDLKTPEGVYEIIEKYHNPRWRWFLRLNYPNATDRQRYETLLHEGLVPVVAGRRRQVGGAIGIHGTDRPRFNRLDVDWTLGCISVDNGAIDTLDRILPVGTVVIINP